MNVGFNNENYQKIHIAEIIKKLMPDLRIEVIKEDLDKRDYQVDFSKIEKCLAIKNAYRVEDGVNELINSLNIGIINNPQDRIYYNRNSRKWKVFEISHIPAKFVMSEVSQDETIEEVRQLCQKCNSVLSYDDWITCAGSLSSLGHIGEDLFVLLSTGNGSKDSIDSIRRKYRSCENLERINIGSFFHVMKKYNVV